MIASWLSLALSIATPATHARGFESYAVQDCIELEYGTNLFLFWDSKDRYSREIRYRILKEPCSQSKYYASKPGIYKKIPASGKIPYVGLSRRTLSELDQIRRGANEILYPYPTGETYLRHMPIYDFTVETNRILTQKYGHGFAQEVYQAWVGFQGNNRTTQDLLFSRFQELRAMDILARNQSMMKANSKGAVLAIALGLNWEEEPNEDTKDYIVDFFDLIRELGIQSQVLHRHRYGTIEENHALLVAQLRDILSSGRDVVLYGLSKGAPEILSAAAEVVGPYLDSQRRQANLPKGWGRISGAFLGSPMLHGTFWARGFMKKKHPDLAAFFSRIGWTDIAGLLHVLPTMTPESLNERMNSVYPRLPDDIRYLTASGVVGGNGLLEKDTTGMDFFLNRNRKQNTASGSNDGFIEYPGTQLPRKYFSDSSMVIIQASHMILDGSWNGTALSDLDTRHAAFTSFLTYLFQ